MASRSDRPIPNDRGPQWHSQRSPRAAGWRLTSTRNSHRYPRIVPLMRRQRSTALELLRSCLIVMLRMAEVAIRLERHFESRFTMFEVHYYFGGFRVCVRWLPIKRIGGASFTNPHVSVAAVFTCAAIRPVNSNPSRNLIPKNEIIWHMQSPPCAMQLRCHNAATRTRPSGRGAIQSDALTVRTFAIRLVPITAASLRFPSELATVMTVDAKLHANFRGRLKNCQ